MNGKPVEIHKLDELLQNVEVAINTVPATEAPIILGTLERLKAVVWSKLLTTPRAEQAAGELLTIPQVAERLKLSPYRTYELCRQGALKAIKLGKAVRVKPEDLAAYISNNVD